VTEVTLNGDMLASHRYGASGALSEETHSGALRRSYTRDADGRVTRQLLRKGNRVIVDRRYRYDARGDLVERAEIIREKGTDRSRFFRGQVDKYTWVDVGSSYLPSDILAAFLLAQLEQRREIQKKRGAIWRYYFDCLGRWAEESGVGLPKTPAHCEQSFHMFYLIMPSLKARQSFISHLGGRGVMAVFHYQPLHLAPMGRRFGGREGLCPVTENIADRLVRLPFDNKLSRDEQDQVVEAVLSWPG